MRFRRRYPKLPKGLLVFSSFALLSLFSSPARPEAEYPLQIWMKANTAAAMARSDLPALAAAFESVARLAPKEYPNWASIARDGAAAARTDNLAGAKAACRSCHTQYRAKYKFEMRARPFP